MYSEYENINIIPYQKQAALSYIFKTTKRVIRVGWIAASGRNFSGKICVFHRGGGKKFNYSRIDFYRRVNCFGHLLKQFKVKHHTAYLGLIAYHNGLISYIIAPADYKSGTILFSGSLRSSGFSSVDRAKGTALPLKAHRLFTRVYSVEYYPFCGSALARAAGVSAYITAGTAKLSIIKLRSGWMVKLSNKCLAALGSAGNPDHRFVLLGKAGNSRSLGVRPTVRGVAKNPCDHPHGGGEGKKSPPASARTPWGKLTKGTPTRSRIRRYSQKCWKIVKKKIQKFGSRIRRFGGKLKKPIKV